MDYPEKLSKARAKLSLMEPFFSCIMFQHPMLPSENIKTFGVNARGTIFYNPQYVEKLSVNKIIFVLCHEILHVVYGHVWRRGERDHKLWNIAGDAVINETLIGKNVGEFAEGGIRLCGAENMTTEEIYDRLKNDAKNAPQLPDELADLLPSDGSEEGGAPLSESDIANIEATTAQEIAQAKATLGNDGIGKLPSNLQRYIEKILAGRKLPWYEMLAKYMTKLVAQETSWKRPNKRFSQYMPTLSRTPGMGTVVVGIDTSGSISDRELGVFATHVKDVFDETNPEKIVVVYADSQVNHEDVFENQEELKFEMYGGGGTDMRVIGEYCDKMAEAPDVCIIFTDGYTPFPERENTETIWVVTEEGSNVPEHINKVVFKLED